MLPRSCVPEEEEEAAAAAASDRTWSRALSTALSHARPSWGGGRGGHSSDSAPERERERAREGEPFEG